VGQAHKALAVVDRAVATTFALTSHERRAVNRSELGTRPTDVHTAVGIPRMLNKFRRRLCAPLAHSSRVHSHARPLDIRSGFTPDLERPRVVAILDSDLLEQPIGLCLDAFDSFGGGNIDVRDGTMRTHHL